MNNKQPIYTFKPSDPTDRNTFYFFVDHIPAKGKRQKETQLVTVEQITDWTGTDFENDEILCQPSIWKVSLPGFMSTEDALNAAGRGILRDWQYITLPTVA